MPGASRRACPLPSGHSRERPTPPRPRGSPRLLIVGGMQRVFMFFVFSYVFPSFYNGNGLFLQSEKKKSKMRCSTLMVTETNHVPYSPAGKASRHWLLVSWPSP